MNIGNIRDGLSIFAKIDGADKYCAAEHDVLYAGETPPNQMQSTHRAALEKLGWMWDEDLETWYAFT